MSSIWGTCHFGLAGRKKGYRTAGIIIVFVAVLKLFFIDLWELGTLYRIVSSIVFGLMLLGISFIYQKYKERLKEII